MTLLEGMVNIIFVFLLNFSCYFNYEDSWKEVVSVSLRKAIYFLNLFKIPADDIFRLF